MPNTTSNHIAPVSIFAAAQPTKRPIAISGAKYGSTHSPSDSLSCISPLLMGAIASVNNA